METFSRSVEILPVITQLSLCGGIGIHNGLKIRRVNPMPVRPRPETPHTKEHKWITLRLESFCYQLLLAHFYSDASTHLCVENLTCQISRCVTEKTKTKSVPNVNPVTDTQLHHPNSDNHISLIYHMISKKNLVNISLQIFLNMTPAHMQEEVINGENCTHNHSSH